MNSREIFLRTISESAKRGSFDQSLLMAQASEMTRELRDEGAPPEVALKSVKHVLGGTVVTPPDRMKEAIVTYCIKTFFEK